MGKVTSPSRFSNIFGELIGGMVMPAIAGLLADKYGLTAALYLAVIGPITGGLLAFLTIETAPMVLSKRKVDQTIPA